MLAEVLNRNLDIVTCKHLIRVSNHCHVGSCVLISSYVAVSQYHNKYDNKGHNDGLKK